MRKIDINQFRVIKAGIEHKSDVPVKLHSIMSIMEKNESYIWWLQPTTGNLQSQVASICINEKFYALNLRLEKIIFRHIRLTKNFENVELLEDGTKKLRIPAMQKSAKLIDSGPKTISSRRKAKTAKFSLLDVDRVQKYMRQMCVKNALTDASSLIPSLENTVLQMKRIITIEFPHVNLDDVFVNRDPTLGISSDSRKP